MADDLTPVEAPPWAAQVEPGAGLTPVEKPPWADKVEPPAPRSVLGRAGQAAADTFMSGARAWLPDEGERNPLTALAKTHQRVMSPVTMTLGPVISAGGSLLASGVSEAARRITGGDEKRSEEMYEYALPQGEAALSALGARPGIAGAGKYPMPDPRLPTVRKVPGKGPEAEAARYLELKANDPDFAAKLAAPVEEIAGPGDLPSTFQHTGVQGIGQAEKAAARRPGQVEEHLDLKQAQNAARQKALEDLQPAGSPSAVSEHLRDTMRTATADADEVARLAQQRAWEETQRLGGTNDPTTYGNIFRRELQMAEDAARAAERQAWQRIDPDGTLRANPMRLQEAERGVYGTLTETAQASITPAEREIMGLIQNYRPVISFQEMRDLRSLVSTALREELYTKGQTPAYARLSRLRQAVEDGVQQSVFDASGGPAGDVAARMREASALTRERVERFRPTRAITRREGVEGPYKMEDVSAIPEKLIASGPKGYDRASQYLRAVGNERGLPELTDAIAATARREVINPDGTINPRKLEGWLRRYQDTLRAIDERDGGAFSQRLRNLQTAQETIEAAEARQAAVAARYKNDQLKGLLGATDDATVERVIGGIFGRNDAVPLAQQLMDRLSGNNAAIEGARAAVVRHIRERLTSNAPIGPGLDMNDLALRAEQFQKWVTNRGNNAALRVILRPEQVDSLERIALSLRRATRSNQTKAVGAGSDTYQNFLAGEEQAGALTELARKWGPWIGRAITTGLGHTFGGFAGGAAAVAAEAGIQAVRTMRAARKTKRIATVQELFDEAILNPEKARALLGKKETYKPRMMGQRAGEAYAVGAERARERRPERALRQAGGGVPAIGGTGGRSPGTTTPPGPRAARAGTGQALSDGGEAGQQPTNARLKRAPERELPPSATRAPVDWSKYGHMPESENIEDRRGDTLDQIKQTLVAPTGYNTDEWATMLRNPLTPIEESLPHRKRADGGEVEAPLSGSRERLAAALQASVASGGLGKTGAEKKKLTPLAREDIIKQLQARGLSTAGWETVTGVGGESRVPSVDSRADGGEVDFEGDKLPLPGQSRGLGRAPDEELPAMRRNKAGETLPGYIARNWAEGMVDLAKTPGRVYREGMTDEDVDFGPSMALNMMGARTPAAAKPGSGIGMFGGRGAKTANLDMLAKAQEMRAEGVPHQSIWAQTGWVRGPDGHWRFEIPDEGSYVKPLERIQQGHPTLDVGSWPTHRMSRPGTYHVGELQDVLHHPEFFEAYPQFKDMPAVLELGVKPGGAFTPPGGLLAQQVGDVGRMEVRAPVRSEGAAGKEGAYPARRIMLHEGQHAIQAAEGFTGGGNPSALPYSPQQIMNMAKKDAEKAGVPWSLLSRQEKGELGRAVMQSEYEALLGEIESRNVEARRNMGWERNVIPPWATTDRPWWGRSVNIPTDEGVAMGLKPLGRKSPWKKPEPADMPRSIVRRREPGYADGGEVDWEEDKLPLPGQSRGLRSTAGPTVTSTTREEDIPAPRTNKAGETLPTYVLKGMGQGLLDLATAPKRAYTGELSEEEALGFGPQMGLLMTGLGRGQGTLGVGRSGGRGRGRRPPPREPVDETPPPPMGHNMPPEELPVERRRVSSLGLRDMPIERAIEQARTEQHVIPSNPKVREGYVGAPDWVKTPEDLARMRAQLDAQVEAGMHGAKWYKEAQAGIKEMAGPDPKKQHLLAQQKAVTSAQATPETNLGFALQGHNAAITGKPLDIVRTGDIGEKMAEGERTGEIRLGRKTGIYAGHMDPTMEDPSTGTNDIWHARSFGYENPEGGLGAQQHAFMDAETVLAVHRANERKLGGRSDWTPGEIQAAPWVFNKAQGLQEQFGWSPEKAMAEAVKTYNSFFDKHTAFGTHEATPGVGTRHLPGVAQGTEAERAAFAADPRSSWRDPSGRDIMYQSLGMYTRPSVKATGVFEGPEGLEINPAEAARPMVSFEGGAGKRQVDPASRRLMDAAEAARAYMDVQNAGAWSIPIEKQQVGQSTSAYIHRPGGGPLPIEDIGKLQAIGARHGLPGVIDYGEGTALTSFGGGPTGRQLGKSNLPAETAEALGVSPQQVKQVKLDTGYINYQSLWGNKQGTGSVTRALQDHLVSKDAPAILKRLDASPELRQAVAARLERDAEVARQTGQPIRRDVQRARAIFVKSGFSGLFRALAKGAALPAVAFAPLAELLQSQQREEAPVE